MCNKLNFIAKYAIHVTCRYVMDAEDEREFDYGRKSKHGPKHWGTIKREWQVCSKGEMQSPVDMSNQRVEIVSGSKELKKHYHPSNATVINRGHDIAVK